MPFELVTGQMPFTAEDMPLLVYQIAKEWHPSARSMNGRTPGVVEKIIDKALEKDIEKRYQKAGLMAEHLRKVIAKIDEIKAKKRNDRRL